MSASKRSAARQGIAERTDKQGRTQYRGTAYDKRAGRHLRGPWTPTLAEARAWRVDALAALQAGTRSADRGITVREAVDQFLDGIDAGAIRTRSGHAHKPSTTRGYRRELTNRVVPAFGAARLTELALPDVQRWADTLSAEALSASTVRNVVTALRALYAWALPRGLARANPTAGLRLPTGAKARERIAAPREAAALIAAARPLDQAAFGLAVYSGLRLGELLALEWEHVTSTPGPCGSSARGTTARAGSSRRSRRREPGRCRSSRASPGCSPITACSPTTVRDCCSPAASRASRSRTTACATGSPVRGAQAR